MVDTLDNASAMSAKSDDSMSRSSKPSIGSNLENTSVTKTSSWWSALGFEDEEDEVRTVVIGPGKLGYTIQSTERGPMIVGCPEEPTSGESFFDAFANQLGSSYFSAANQAPRAKIMTGELFLGDILVQIDKIPTDKISGKDLALLLHRKINQPLRTLTVSHPEGTGLTTVYQPGPYGSAAIAGVLNNANDHEEFEDEGVIGAGYWKNGLFS